MEISSETYLSWNVPKEKVRVVLLVDCQVASVAGGDRIQNLVPHTGFGFDGLATQVRLNHWGDEQWLTVLS